MPILPLLPIVLPLLGAVGTVGVSLLPRIAWAKLRTAAQPYARGSAQVIAVVAAAATTLLLLVSGWGVRQTVVPSLWQPSILFGTTLALQFDASVNALAVAMALVTLAAMLAEAGRRERGLPMASAGTLMLLGLGIFSLSAGNVVTLLMGWTVYDVLLAVGQMASGRPPREAARRLFLGGIATLLVWAGALVSPDGAAGRLWPLMPMTGTRATLWALAGLLRVWAFPFHLSSPDGMSPSSGSAPLFLGPLLGWGLWVRLATANGGALPPDQWIPNLALMTMAIGGLLAWSPQDARRSLPWAGVAAAGGVLVAGRAAGTSAAPIIEAGGLGWALAMTTLILCSDLARAGLQRRRIWWGVPAWLGAASLVGFPLTLGFVTSAPLIGGLVRGGSVSGGVGLVVSQLFLVPALVRWLRLPTDQPLPRHRVSQVVWLIGLGLPVAGLVVLGVAPSAFRLLTVPRFRALVQLLTVPGWAVWVVSLVFGGILAWQEQNLRPRVGYQLDIGHDLWRLDWLYGAVGGALDRGLGLVRAADDLVGGTGALLWSMVIFLIIILVWAA